MCARLWPVPSRTATTTEVRGTCTRLVLSFGSRTNTTSCTSLEIRTIQTEHPSHNQHLPLGTDGNHVLIGESRAITQASPPGSQSRFSGCGQREGVRTCRMAGTYSEQKVFYLRLGPSDTPVGSPGASPAPMFSPQSPQASSTAPGPPSPPRCSCIWSGASGLLWVTGCYSPNDRVHVKGLGLP